MALYYLLPTLTGVFLGTILTTILTKVTATPRATVINALTLATGYTFLTFLLNTVLPNAAFSFILFVILTYFLILKIYPISHTMGAVFVILNFVFSVTLSVLFVPFFAEAAISFLF